MTMLYDLRGDEAPHSRRRVLAPYLAGAGLGALSWIAFAVAHDPLGITTALSRAGQPVAALVLGADAAARNDYWRTMPFTFDYGVLFLVGTLLGSLAFALVFGRFRWETVPTFWRERFGDSVLKRYVSAFLAGATLMFGARLAGGCTSGHALSGGLQLALSSWVFIAVLFASGVAASALIYGRGSRK